MISIDLASYVAYFLVLVVVTSCFALAITLDINSRRLLRLLVGYSAVLSVATAFSITSSLAGAEAGVPDLIGDGKGYYLQATILMEHGILDFADLIRSNYLGYQIFLAGLFSLFGEHLLIGVLVNNLLLVSTANAIYRVSLHLSSSDQVAFYSCLAFVLTPQNAYYSALLLKDPAIIFAFSIYSLALVRLLRKRQLEYLEVALLFVSLAVVGTMRTTFVLFMLIEAPS